MAVISRAGVQSFHAEEPRASDREPLTVNLELALLDGVDASRVEYGVVDVVVYGYDVDGNRIAAPPHRAWLDPRDNSLTGLTNAEALEIQAESVTDDVVESLIAAGVDATSFEVIE